MTLSKPAGGRIHPFSIQIEKRAWDVGLGIHLREKDEKGVEAFLLYLKNKKGLESTSSNTSYSIVWYGRKTASRGELARRINPQWKMNNLRKI